MPRRVSVKSRALRTKANYSRENIGFQFALPASVTNGLYQEGTVIVPASSVQGTRTISKLRVTVNLGDQASYAYWALVYVPQGTTANALFSTSGAVNSGSLYEPNQFVMASGVIDPNAGNHDIRSPISRKLHSGDFISLIVGTGVGSQTISGLVNYSVKYN